ncbi:hypothetical protein [Nocardia sp. NPDC050710]|uniref:hypothetical protein n=1 Tax=Nocardia sp. NPDC050710 TaxID=3157220 RepID=UPI003410D79B
MVGTTGDAVAQLDHGHDVEDSVDLAVVGAGAPISLLLARGRVQAVVPFQEANRSGLSKRWMSPVQAVERDGAGSRVRPVGRRAS